MLSSRTCVVVAFIPSIAIALCAAIKLYVSAKLQLVGEILQPTKTRRTPDHQAVAVPQAVAVEEGVLPTLVPMKRHLGSAKGFPVRELSGHPTSLVAPPLCPFHILL